MLHIARKIGEVIRVGDDLRITVTHASNGSVRLSFDAPTSLPIYREEVYQRIQAAQRGTDGHDIDIQPPERDAPCASTV